MFYEPAGFGRLLPKICVLQVGEARIQVGLDKPSLREICPPAKTFAYYFDVKIFGEGHTDALLRR